MPIIPRINLSKEDRQMAVLSVLVLLLVAITAYFFVFAPGWKKAGKVYAQVAEMKTKTLRAREMIEDKARIQRIAKETSAKLERVKQWIPEETDTSWILRLVGDVEKIQKTRTVAIKPLKEEKDEAGEDDQGFFRFATCQIELKTDYHSLGKFMDQLERKNPYIAIKGISIVSSFDDTQRHEVAFKIQYLKSKVSKKDPIAASGPPPLPSPPSIK